MVFAALEVKCLVAPIDLAVVRKKKNKEEESAATILLAPDAAESTICSSSLHISKACYYSGSSNNDGGKGRGRFSQIVFEGRASRTELEQYLLLGEASADARLANITMLLKGL